MKVILGLTQFDKHPFRAGKITTWSSLDEGDFRGLPVCETSIPSWQKLQQLHRWISHYPASIKFSSFIGHDLNKH